MGLFIIPGKITLLKIAESCIRMVFLRRNSQFCLKFWDESDFSAFETFAENANSNFFEFYK